MSMFELNMLDAMDWQRTKAENLTKLVRLKNYWYRRNTTDFFDNWVTSVFNLQTANEFGLYVWSLILNLPLFGGDTGSPPDYPAFGFAPFGGNFFNYNFATDSDEIYRLTLEQKRTLLQLRYFTMTTDCVPPKINKFLAYLFAFRSVYVQDNYDMTATYFIKNIVSDNLVLAMQDFELLPVPADVKAIYQRQ